MNIMNTLYDSIRFPMKRPARLVRDGLIVHSHPSPLPRERENKLAAIGESLPVNIVVAQQTKRDGAGVATAMCGQAKRVYRRSFSPGKRDRVRASVFPFPKDWFVAAIAGLLALIPPTHAGSAAADTNAAAAPAVVATHPQSSTALAVEDIRDIRPPFHVPPGWLWAAWVAGGCSALVLAYALWRWRHRIPGLRPKLPYELALEKLEAARSLMQPATAREFSIAVSVVVRNYIEVRFATYAAHRTTDEFLHSCMSASDSPLTGYRQPLGEFLGHCDLAKFARWILSVPEMEAMLQSASLFVRETGQTTSTPDQFPAHSNRARSTLHHVGAERTDAPDSTSNTLSASTVTPG